MTEYIHKFSSFPFVEEVDPKLTTFQLWDDCVLLESVSINNALPKTFDESYYYDRTECEASLNHLHINTLLANDEMFEQSVCFAFTLLTIWEFQLRNSFQQKTFHIVLSIQAEDVVLRCYTVRTNEVTWVDLENMEAYEEEALLVKVIGNQ